MLADMLSVTARVWLEPIARVSLLPTLSVALFPAETDASLEAFMNISSLPALSSMRISLVEPPPGVVAVWTDMRVLSLGSAYGGGDLAVVHAAEDEGQVGVAVGEVEVDLPAHARREHAAAERELAGADPQARRVVGLAQPVPGEDHLHPPVLVGVDLLARRARGHRHLGARRRHRARHARRPVRGLRRGDGAEREALAGLEGRIAHRGRASSSPRALRCCAWRRDSSETVTSSTRYSWLSGS